MWKVKLISLARDNDSGNINVTLRFFTDKQAFTKTWDFDVLSEFSFAKLKRAVKNYLEKLDKLDLAETELAGYIGQEIDIT